jgi:isoamylase
MPRHWESIEGAQYLKGIDNATYYIMTDDPRAPYADYSGCGNTVRAANRAVRHLIRESLRYWVTEMHVDGFRFDLAAVAARGPDGSVGVDDPPLFGDLTIPELAGVRLIAEPWDAGGLYQLGSNFPGLRMRQWNGRFRDDVRRFVRGDAGMVGTLMARLYGRRVGRTPRRAWCPRPSGAPAGREPGMARVADRRPGRPAIHAFDVGWPRTVPAL